MVNCEDDICHCDDPDAQIVYGYYSDGSAGMVCQWCGGDIVREYDWHDFNDCGIQMKEDY